MQMLRCTSYVTHAGISMAECDFWRGEELLVQQTARCTRCRNCCKCKTENINLSRLHADQLDQMRQNMELIPDESNPSRGHLEFFYPECKLLELLPDNLPQVIRFQGKIEKDLDLNDARTAYNDNFYEYVDNDVFVELSEQEMAEHDGPVN